MILDKLNKLSLPATILIVSIILSGVYFASQVNKQRSVERQQQIKVEQEKQAKEESEQALNTCIANAEENYYDRWHEECKAQGKLTNKCIDIKELSYDEYLKKYELTSEDYVKQRNLVPPNPNDPDYVHAAALWDYFLVKRSNECSCRLLISTADRLNERLEKSKAECFKRHPQN